MEGNRMVPSFSVPASNARRSFWFTVALIGIVLASALLTPRIASAHQSWPYATRPYSGAGTLYVYYDNNCSPSDFESAVTDSARNWSNTPTPLWFVVQSTGCQPHQSGVDTFTGWWSDTSVPAQTWNYVWRCPPLQSCYWDSIWMLGDKINSSVIRMNTNGNSFRNLGSFGMRNAMTHEIGHTLGLDHVPCSDALSIMNTGGCNSNINTPQQHDINDINSMY